jgi:hypothetical protein
MYQSLHKSKQTPQERLIANLHTSEVECISSNLLCSVRRIWWSKLKRTLILCNMCCCFKQSWIGSLTTRMIACPAIYMNRRLIFFIVAMSFFKRLVFLSEEDIDNVWIQTATLNASPNVNSHIPWMTELVPHHLSTRSFNTIHAPTCALLCTLSKILCSSKKVLTAGDNYMTRRFRALNCLIIPAWPICMHSWYF